MKSGHSLIRINSKAFKRCIQFLKNFSEKVSLYFEISP